MPGIAQPKHNHGFQDDCTLSCPRNSDYRPYQRHVLVVADIPHPPVEGLYTDGLSNCTDAMKWAEAFCYTVVNEWDTGTTIDPGSMVVWFANAMAAQEMAMTRSRSEAGVDDFDIALEYDPGEVNEGPGTVVEVEAGTNVLGPFNSSLSPPAGIHLVVHYKDGRTGFFPVSRDQGWKIDTANRMLVVGRGVPRTHIPLDGVDAFEVEECHPR